MTDYENIRLIKQPARRISRQHQWRRPWESVVENLLGADNLDAIRRASMGLTIPVPILSMLQVQVYQGELLPVIFGGGFNNLSDLIAAATSGKNQYLPFSKVGVTGVAAASNTLWFEGNTPVAGATAGALAAGTNLTRATQGALGQFNPPTGQQFIVSGSMQPTVAAMNLLVYDRIWHGLPAVSTTGAQTVTMTPTRYAGTGANPSSAGNFIATENQAALGATAHTITYTYVDDQNNTAEAAAAVTGLNAGIAKRFDTNQSAPFVPLNTGDVGASDITVYNNNASVTGAQAIVLGHPLCFMSGPTANLQFPMDYINGSFQLPRVFDDACIAFLELIKNATGATTYTGHLITTYSAS